MFADPAKRLVLLHGEPDTATDQDPAVDDQPPAKRQLSDLAGKSLGQCGGVSNHIVDTASKVTLNRRYLKLFSTKTAVLLTDNVFKSWDATREL